MDLLYPLLCPLRRAVVAAKEAAGAEGSQGHLEVIGDFLVGELVEVGELEHQAVRNWQMGDDGGHSGGGCGTARPGSWCRVRSGETCAKRRGGFIGGDSRLGFGDPADGWRLGARRADGRGLR